MKFEYRYPYDTAPQVIITHRFLWWTRTKSYTRFIINFHEYWVNDDTGDPLPLDLLHYKIINELFVYKRDSTFSEAKKEIERARA